MRKYVLIIARGKGSRLWSINTKIDGIDELLTINQIKRQLEKEYSIMVEKIEKSKESTDGNVFICYSNNKKYAIKIYDDIIHTKAMTALHLKLISTGFDVPKIIFSKDNKEYITLYNKNLLVVYSFMEGKKIDWNKFGKIDEYIINKIAKTLRKLHSVTNGENKFELPKLPFINKSDINRYSVLHFDLTRNNIFINEYMKSEIGFIDFDDAKYGPSVCDVAIAIANLFFSKTRGVDIYGVYKFMDEYYYNEPELKNKEVPFIKKFALQWIDYILDGNEFDTSTTESFIIRRQLIDQNLLI